MQSKTYDSVTEKYLDFSFEKTNSAYMLFYERRVEKTDEEHHHFNEASSTAADSNIDMSINMASCSTKLTSTIIAESSQSTTNNELKDNSNIIATATTATDTEDKPNTSSSALSSAPASDVLAKIQKIENETESSELKNSNLARNQCDIDSKSIAKGKQHQKCLTKDALSNAGGGNGSLLSKELEEWIWQDNRHFLQDRNIFEHTYFK